MMNSISIFQRRLDYLQEWIGISVENHADRLIFNSIMEKCGIDPGRFPSDRLVYEDFAGYCSSREKEDWLPFEAFLSVI